MSPGSQPFLSRLRQQLEAVSFGLQPGTDLGAAVCIRSLFKHSRAVLSLWNSRVLSPSFKQPEEFAPQALMPSSSPEGSPGMAPVVQ